VTNLFLETTNCRLNWDNPPFSFHLSSA
jgi:hypothetical protein